MLTIVVARSHEVGSIAVAMPDAWPDVDDICDTGGYIWKVWELGILK